MPDVYDLADQFRDRLLRRERDVAAQMVRRYAAVYRHIQDEVSVILDEFDALISAGEELSVAKLLQLQRLQQLQVQIRREVGQFAAWAGEQIQVGQAWAVDQAAADAERLMRAAIGRMPPGVAVSFNRLNRAATSRLIANLQDESPLARLIDAMGPRAAEAVKQALVNGVALGRGAREIARDVREASGETLTRSLRIARTETLRAYREGTRETYKANDDIVGEWEWRSARQARTCAACWAMDGQRFPLTTPMSEHPNGRCMQLPVIDREKLGLTPGTSRRSSETGAQAFERLSEADKRRILGAKYDAYKRGEITLADVVGTRHSEDWGDTIFEKSARALGVTAEKPALPEEELPPAARPVMQPAASVSVEGAGDTPVSSAFRLVTDEPLKNALRAIDSVHSDGDLPTTTIQFGPTDSGVRGTYYAEAPYNIVIGTPQPGVQFSPLNTTYHEVGHFLDHWGLSDGESFASRQASDWGKGPLAGWWKSVEKSEAYSKLLRGLERAQRFEDQATREDAVKYVEYLLKPEELWARSYNQYIANRVGDTRTLAQLDDSDPATQGIIQWKQDDFETIQAEIDQMMRSRGWRK